MDALALIQTPIQELNQALGQELCQERAERPFICQGSSLGAYCGLPESRPFFARS